jgi:pyruvate formate lyase activating enzyme
MDIYGEVSSPLDLAREVLKDKAYFQKSGGGVTLSGGEPTMQTNFAKELLTIFRQAGIHTALDTCGQCSWETLEELLPHTDMILYDLKEINPAKHKEFTGVSNTRILENLALLGRFIKEQRKPLELWIRTPLIPGYTNTQENIRGIGAFIVKHLGQSISRWELCTFNKLCIHKYDGLGIKWKFGKSPLLSRDDAQMLALLARNSGPPPEVIHLSGPTQESNPEESPDKNIAQSISG